MKTLNYLQQFNQNIQFAQCLSPNSSLRDSGKCVQALRDIFCLGMYIQILCLAEVYFDTVTTDKHQCQTLE